MRMDAAEMAEGSKSLVRRIETLSPRGLWMAGVAIAAAAVLLVSGAAALVVRHTWAWVGWRPILLAAAVVSVVPVVGLWPLGSCETSDPTRIAKAAYTGTPIRMVTALVLGLLVFLGLADASDRKAFGVWLGGLYLVSLAAEMVVLAVWLRGRGGRTRV
jgi:hypothetical protein